MTIPATDDAALLACPFCGSDASLTSDSRNRDKDGKQLYSVVPECDCGAAIYPWFADDHTRKGIMRADARATAAWNTRTPPPMQWREIESAPRDGTEILLGEWYQPRIGKVYWRVQIDSLQEDQEVFSTHWMPLPPAPEA
jgi:hypothetical protein